MYPKSIRVPLDCAACGTRLERLPSQLKHSRSGRVFCSNVCKWTALRRVAARDTCRQCGGLFIRRRAGDPRRYCSAACYHIARRLDPESSFWAKIDKNGPIPAHRPDLGPCWLWTGTVDSDGYGMFTAGGGERFRAPRFSLALHNGPIPDGFWALHHCDNPPCARPDHLFQGTAADNSTDKTTKRRDPIGNQNGSRKHPELLNPPLGEANGYSKLTDQKVREIRQRYAAGERPLRALGAAFGVSATSVLRIVRREAWTHI